MYLTFWVKNRLLLVEFIVAFIVEFNLDIVENIFSDKFGYSMYDTENKATIESVFISLIS